MSIAAFPQPLLDLMARQFGAVARYQLIDHLTVGTVNGLVRRGALVCVERGVYRARGGACSPAQRAMAAALRARPGAVVSGPLVLALLGVDGFTGDLPFEVLVAPHRRPTGVDFTWRPDPTPEATKASVGALPIVTPTAALVDSARWLDRLTARRLRAGFDAARWSGLTTTQRVRERAERLGPDDPGAAFFLELFAEGGGQPESEKERVLGRLLADFDPPPESQVWLTPRRRTDWYFREPRVAVEYNGTVDHTGPSARERDAEREDELADLGILVVTVTAADLGAPDDLRAWLRVILARRARELPAAG